MGRFRPDRFQRVSGWCEDIGIKADGRPGAGFLKVQ